MVSLLKASLVLKTRPPKRNWPTLFVRRTSNRDEYSYAGRLSGKLRGLTSKMLHLQDGITERGQEH